MALERAQWPWYGALLVGCLGLGMLAGMNPAIAIGAALAAVFVLVLTANLTAGLALFILAAFAERAPALGGDLTLVKLLGALLALSWLAMVATGRAGDRVLPARHPALVVAMVLWVAWMLLSMSWAEDEAIAQGDAQRYVLNLLLVPIVFTAVRTRRDAVVVTSVFVGGAVVFGLVAIATAQEEAGFARISGITGTANELASLLVTALLLACGLALAARRMPIGRLLAIASVGICLLALFLTFSRAGLVALAAAVVASVFLAGRWRIGALVVAVVIGVTALGYFSFAAPERARERVTTVGDGGTGRTDIWTVAWRMVEDKPLTGVGPGNFRTSSIHYLLEPGTIRRDDFIVDRPQVAHNSYLQVLAEQGVPGLALFLAIILTCLGCAWRAARTFARLDDPVLEPISRALVLAIVALLVADIFASDQLNKELWLLLGLGPAFLAIARDSSRATSGGPAS